MLTPAFDQHGVTVHFGDCLDVLAALPDGSVDAVVTDPPYGLDFRANGWDRFGTGEAFGEWCRLWAVQCLRVLKPGGHLVAFGGTRTWHRLMAAVEDARFEVRDSMAWLYATGFPKSHNVSKALDKAAGADREPDVYEDSAYPQHVYGKGVGSGRMLSRGEPVSDAARRFDGWGTALKPSFEPIVVARKPFPGTVAANVLAHGTGGLNIDGCRGAARPTRLASPGWAGATGTERRWPANVVLDDVTAEALGDHAVYYPTFRYQPKAPQSERPVVDGVRHPTVKPLALMRWLVRLVTPPDGVVLDPFLGSGTTAQAARDEGFRCIGIERNPNYLPLITTRLQGR